jgi:hypothetical protein
LEELILGLLIHDPETTDILHIEESQDLDGANRLIAFLEFKRGILKVDSLRAKINLGKDGDNYNRTFLQYIFFLNSSTSSGEEHKDRMQQFH